MREILQRFPREGMTDVLDNLRIRNSDTFVEFEIRHQQSDASDYYVVIYVLPDLIQQDDAYVIAAIPVALEQFLQVLRIVIDVDIIEDHPATLTLYLVEDGEDDKYGRNGEFNNCGIFRATDPETGHDTSFISTVIEDVSLDDLFSSGTLYEAMGRIIETTYAVYSDILINIEALSTKIKSIRKLSEINSSFKDDQQKLSHIMEELMDIADKISTSIKSRIPSSFVDSTETSPSLLLLNMPLKTG